VRGLAGQPQTRLTQGGDTKPQSPIPPYYQSRPECIDPLKRMVLRPVRTRVGVTGEGAVGVLDDVWELRHAVLLDIVGTKGRVLLTSAELVATPARAYAAGTSSAALARSLTGAGLMHRSLDAPWACSNGC
jgi:hypothetical protein